MKLASLCIIAVGSGSAIVVSWIACSSGDKASLRPAFDATLTMGASTSRATGASTEARIFPASSLGGKPFASFKASLRLSQPPCSFNKAPKLGGDESTAFAEPPKCMMLFSSKSCVSGRVIPSGTFAPVTRDNIFASTAPNAPPKIPPNNTVVCHSSAVGNSPRSKPTRAAISAVAIMAP